MRLVCLQQTLDAVEGAESPAEASVSASTYQVGALSMLSGAVYKHTGR